MPRIWGSFRRSSYAENASAVNSTAAGPSEKLLILIEPMAPPIAMITVSRSSGCSAAMSA